MDTNKKTSSSLKVGILTLTAIAILIFTILWIKGRSLSAGERIDVAFRDVNGIRAGSGVQMMGLRIGQIEEITPIIDGKDSYVKLRFVITEKGIKIPKASTISIQQSGLIGEQFLEITPPKSRTLFVETSRPTTSITKNQNVYMYFGAQKRIVGRIDSTEVVPTSQIPLEYKSKFKTKNALKINYILNMPGLILDSCFLGAKIEGKDIVFFLKDGTAIELPKADSPYTVVEPMRISDFMELQYRAAQSLSQTNQRIAEVLSDDLVLELQASVQNINRLTQRANTTLGKADVLIDSSRQELNSVLVQSDILVSKLIVLSDNVNDIVSDKDLKNTIVNSAVSMGRLSDNLNTLIEDKQTKEMLANLNEVSRNLADISSYVNEFTQDEDLKNNLTNTVKNVNKAVCSINTTLESLNELDQNEKIKLNTVIADAVVTSRNLKKFSAKLNKRFLLFRLMF